MLDLPSINKILTKNKYRVKVVANEDLVMVEFPRIMGLGKDHAYYKFNEVFEVNGEVISVPIWGARGYFFADLIRRCNLIQYNPLLIWFYIGNKRVDEITLMDYIPLKLTKEESLKEQSLKNLIVEYFVGDQEKLLESAKELGIDEGFEKILELLTSGIEE